MRGIHPDGAACGGSGASYGGTVESVVGGGSGALVGGGGHLVSVILPFGRRDHVSS